jgi:hypothetical protein
MAEPEGEPLLGPAFDLVLDGPLGKLVEGALLVDGLPGPKLKGLEDPVQFFLRRFFSVIDQCLARRVREGKLPSTVPPTHQPRNLGERSAGVAMAEHPSLLALLVAARPQAPLPSDTGGPHVRLSTGGWQTQVREVLNQCLEGEEPTAVA